MTSSSFWVRLREARLVRVLAVYLAASWLVLQVASLLQDQLELPRWLTPVGVVLLAIGLVIITATAWVQSHPLTAARAEAEEIPSSWEIDLGDMRHAVARGRVPHLTWARAILGGVVAFSLLFGLAGAYVLIRERGRSLGPPDAVARGAAPGIAVLPFTVNDPALARWREGMVDLLATDLDGVIGLRAIDSRTVLARWRETVKGTEAPELKTAIEVARRAGARYALVGSAVTSGAGMRLAADVYEVSTGASLGQGQVEGSADSIFGLVDRLSIEALRAILRGPSRDLPTVSLANVTTTSLPGLKAYLEAEVLFRRSDFKGAIAAYEQAVKADSSFALALWRLAESYGWQESIESELMIGYAERAARYADRLPPREATLVRASLALDRGTLDGIEPLRQVVQRYPDDVEAWYLLGDTYHHLGQQALVDPGEAERVFTRTVQLDPTFTPAYIHLIDNAFGLHADSARAAGWLAAYGRLAPGSKADVAGRLTFDLAFGGPAARARARADLDTLQTQLLGRIGGDLWHPRFLALQEEVYRLRRQRSDVNIGAAVSLFFNHVSQGKLRAALERMDDPLLPPAFDYALYELLATGLPVPDERVDRAVTVEAAENLEDRRGARWAIFVAGAYAADRARWPYHEQAVAWLRTEAQRALLEGDSTGSRFAEGEALALEGYRQWKEGRRDEAVRALETAQRQATGHGPEGGVNFMLRRWLGNLLLEMGRTRDAERYFASFYPDPLASYRLGKIYEDLGEFPKARESYQLFALGWKDADPELQPMVQEARAAIQRLTSVIKE